MKELIACCGLNCAECDAQIATINNDDKLREATAEKWRAEYHVAEMTASMINCSGCRMEGVKIGHCAECEIRNCARQKDYSTCADCPELETCPTVGWLLNHVPQAKVNLLSLKNFS